MAAAMVDRDRVVPRHLVELPSGQRHVQLGVVEHHRRHPLAGRRLVGLRLEVGLQLAHAADVGVDAVQLVDAAHVAVRIDEAWRDGRLLGIEHAGPRGREIAHVGGRADGEEPAVLDGEGLGARLRAVDGVDARVEDDQVGIGAGSRLGGGRRLRRKSSQAAASDRANARKGGAEPEKLSAGHPGHDAECNGTPARPGGGAGAAAEGRFSRLNGRALLA